MSADIADSDILGTDVASAAAIPTLTNFARLRGHLKSGSLAERLLAAELNAAPGASQAALQEVLHQRLEELRRKYAGAAPNQN